MKTETKKEARSMASRLIQAVRRSLDHFRRPRVTVFLIAVLLALFFAGLIIPQKSLFTSRAQFEQWNAGHPLLSRMVNGLRLNEIYVAPVTVFFLSLFFLNLLSVLVQRLPSTLRRAYLIDRSAAIEGIERMKDDPAALSLVLAGTPPDSGKRMAGEAAAFFRKRFWSVLRSKDGRSFLAIRNRLSPLGFILFHLSFLLCLIGGLLVTYTRFSGTLSLTEGETFYADITRFSKIKDAPKIFKALPELGITLNGVSPRYEGNTATDLNVSVKLQYFSEITDTVVKINQPVNRGAVSILPQSVGVSPLFLIRKHGGEDAQGGYFNLNVLKGDEDSFQAPGYPYTVFVRLYPDYAEEAGRPSTRSEAMNNPVLHLRIQKKERVLFEGLRRPGEWAAFDGLELSCSEIRYWVDFLVVREYGTIPLYTGFFLGAGGLIVRLLFPQKTVRIHVEERGGGCVLYAGGRGEYYPQAFREELERLTASLATVLTKGGQEGSAA